MTTAFPESSDTDNSVEITVRRGGEEDIPFLASLEKECFSSPWSEKSFEDFFRTECSVCFIAESDGKPCGYIGAYIICGEGEITNLAVTEAYRRQGIGKALMEALCRTDGISRLTLDVRESNTPAYSLYTGLGFKVDGKRKNFYQNPREDGILMSIYITDFKDG